jgi:hypothetical protein
MSVAAVAAALSGCTAEAKSGTNGQYGNLRFAYSVPGVCEGCGLDREVLTGSSVMVDVHNINANINYQVRSSNPNVAAFTFTGRCRLTGNAGCFESVSVRTVKSGDADLEMYDDWTGTVLDRITVKVRDASSIETTVKETNEKEGFAKDIIPQPGGVYEVTVNTDVEIVSVARSSDGRELIAEPGIVKGIYADAKILGPSTRTIPSSVATETSDKPSITEYATAKTAGATTVSVESVGMRNSLSFRVK